jgi:SAM-dependent methyltransferase
MNPELQAIADRIESNPFEASGHIYHPLPFPEFQHLKISSNARSAYRKWALIKRSLGTPSSLKNWRVLDVGANAGFYSFCFAKLGATVDAYEPHEYYSSIGHQIVEATDLPVRWYNKPLERDDLLDKQDKQYDIALMLSVFQWISQGNEYLEEATNLLHVIASSSRILFFELGCNHGKSAIHTEERPISWIWELLQHSAYPKRVAYLGSTIPWRWGLRHHFACTEDPINLTVWQRLVTFALRRRWLRNF